MLGSVAISLSTLILWSVDCKTDIEYSGMDFISNTTAVDDDLLTISNQTDNICSSTSQNNKQTSDDGVFCDSISDGYLCWEQTKAGDRAYQPCPFNTNAFAFKDCLPNGTWFRHPVSNIYWTNYTPCFIDRHTPHTVTSIFTGGYLISITALLISMVIFNCFRQLDCTRVSIHKNLFLAYIVNGVAWVIEYTAIVSDGKVLLKNTVWCRMVHVLTQYTTCCNYFWMFCEGFFIHTVIVKTFTIGLQLRNVCYIIGWGIPLIPSAIYTILRSIYGENKRCWTGISPLHWIIQGPITVSLMVSLVLGANILRIVVSKLRTGNPDQCQQTGRGIRATLILIPLLGLHYFIMPFKPTENQRMEFIYNVISAILISFQGLFVAIMFCFLNEEVIYVIRQKSYQLRIQLGFFDNGPSNMHTSGESTSFSTRRPSSTGTSKQNCFETESMILANVDLSTRSDVNTTV